MLKSDHVVVHDDPVRRAEANTIVRIEIPEPPDGEKRWEQLWAGRIANSRFRLCCIPFAAYGLALGDVVEAPEAGPDAYVVKRVLEPSGRRVIRLWLQDSTKETWDEVERIIKSRRLLREFRKPALVAVDAPGDESGAEVETEFRRLAEDGRVQYERGDLPFGRTPKGD